ncbi:hypothetical protein FRACYDRAFT_233095 [Fragilariopsis cylindrus CCMP1102]|uniref:RxLR effector protein n=1 Tax=Fragilariopsis cylindrus CCMP1102 TaxID=635003 RepID=A0A1E7FXP7_9STRA|nr:hypothetical protein FRACYDRAFT_233095 [Fragilariopsis cylindrus CCMP1102]|eukprot:OEU22932.1 hypothetical protein FRACYDRAFT_233095 [Fragilariopsis cylindrus CCMP1102]
MKFGLLFVSSCLLASATAQIRGNASTRRHRLAENDSKFVDLTADISESEMKRIKQRYLMRISSERNPEKEKKQKSAGPKDDPKDAPLEIALPGMTIAEEVVMSMSMSMSMEGGKGGGPDKEKKTAEDAMSMSMSVSMSMSIYKRECLLPTSVRLHTLTEYGVQDIWKRTILNSGYEESFWGYYGNTWNEE